MTFYFVGGEDHDFTRIGACSVDTATTAARSTSNARCALLVERVASRTDGWVCRFDSSQSAFWFTAQMFIESGGSTSASPPECVSFLDGAIRRIGLEISSSTFRLYKRNAAGTKTNLATSSVVITTGVRQKLDIQVSYGVTGFVNVYLNSSLILNYAGDLTTDGTTSLNGAVLGPSHFGIGSGTQGNMYWSEVISASEDTRALSLVTLAPTDNGASFTWTTGNYAAIDEITTDDADTITSATPGQLAQFAVGTAGIIGTPAIRAVCISARAQKGGEGPQNAKLNVRVAGINHLSSTVALPAAMSRIAYTFPVNPGTAGPWAYSDLIAAGFNIGIQSEA